MKSIKKWLTNFFATPVPVRVKGPYTEVMRFNGKTFLLTYLNNKVIEDAQYSAYRKEVTKVYGRNWTL